MADGRARQGRDAHPPAPSRPKRLLAVAVSAAAVAVLLTVPWLLTSLGGPEPGATPPSAASTPTPTLTYSTATSAPDTSQGVGTPAPTASRTPDATPSTGVPARLAGVDWTAIPTSRRVVALTFDDGDGPGLTSILATLAAQHIKATFFPTGEFATARPDAIRAIVAGGHRLGNHSTTHPYFTKIPDAQIRTELSTAESTVRAAGGTSTRPLFRFPYGERNAHTIAVVNQAGYVAVRWTIDTNGWRGSAGGITATGIVDTVLAGARPGAIVLMHPAQNTTDGTTLDADALPRVISELRARGYGFVTLDALLQ